MPSTSKHLTFVSPTGVSLAGKVFAAVQAHWLSACMHVMLELHVADVLVQYSGTAEAPAGPTGSQPAAAAQQGMHIDEVGHNTQCLPQHAGSYWFAPTHDQCSHLIA